MVYCSILRTFRASPDSPSEIAKHWATPSNDCDHDGPGSDVIEIVRGCRDTDVAKLLTDDSDIQSFLAQLCRVGVS